MRIAKPPEGFRLIVRPEVVEQVSTLTDAAPWLPRAFADVKERLRVAGHRVGRETSRIRGGRLLQENDPVTNSPRLLVVYKVLGDTLTIVSLKVIL